MEHHRKLERMYAHAAVNGLYPETVLVVGDGVATVTYRVGPEHHHAASGMHGSVYFKGLDDAAWFAAASVVEDTFVLTARFTVELLRPFGVGPVRAEGRVTEVGSLIQAEAELFDEHGKLLARGHGDFARGRRKLGPDTFYA